jgi:hypothetical protein
MHQQVHCQTYEEYRHKSPERESLPGLNASLYYTGTQPSEANGTTSWGKHEQSNTEMSPDIG